MEWYRAIKMNELKTHLPTWIYIKSNVKQKSKLQNHMYIKQEYMYFYGYMHISKCTKILWE